MMDMKRVDKLKEIEDINNSPGYVFYGDISEDGEVSQDVHDAREHFDFLIQTIKQQWEMIGRYEEALKHITKNTPQTPSPPKINEYYTGIAVEALQALEDTP